MEIHVSIEVPEWVRKMLAKEDNFAAWKWVNEKVARAAISPKAVFGLGPVIVVCEECGGQFEALESLKLCAEHRDYVYKGDDEAFEGFYSSPE